MGQIIDLPAAPFAGQHERHRRAEKGQNKRRLVGEELGKHTQRPGQRKAVARLRPGQTDAQRQQAEQIERHNQIAGIAEDRRQAEERHGQRRGQRPGQGDDGQGREEQQIGSLGLNLFLTQ